MSVSVTCDRCKQPIGDDDVAYVLLAIDPQRIDRMEPVSRAHLHWKCVPTYGRSNEPAEKPND